MKTKKVLVIGASGMLAGPVIRKLDEAGFELRLFSRSVSPSMFINDYEMVQGDLYHPSELDAAVQGCDAIHISISNTDDVSATEAILRSARSHSVKMISLVSGCTVSEENRWFSFIDKKFRAEQMLIQSGIPYFIFRPTWFFESLEMMVRKGKATILGKQPGLFHWVAADDFARMVATAYGTEGTENRIYYVYGPEPYRMKELLEWYCKEIHPDIDKVSEAPIPLLKLIAFLTRNRTLGFASSLFSYFQKVGEPKIPAEELHKLGKAEIDFETWVYTRKQAS